MKIAKNILELIGNTPMAQLGRMNPNPNVTLCAKLEGFNPTGSIKDRIAARMIAQAEADGSLTPSKVIIEASSGNTGIGLALVGAVKGYEVVAVMSEAVSVERQKMILAFGAQIILTPAAEGTDGAIRKVRAMVDADPDRYFCPNQFNNPANKSTHYETTGPEIWAQTEGKITHFVSSLGTSGTLMGTAQYLREKNPNIQIIEAQPIRGHYIQGLKNMQEAIVPAIYDPAQVDRHVMIESEEAFAMARRMVREEGLFVGMSSGAAMCAALRVLPEITEGLMVIICPDRGEKYLSTKLFQA